MTTINPGTNLPALAGRFWLTLLTTLLALALSATDIAFSNSYFDRNLIGEGQIWRLLSGHFTHTSISHLSWDLIAFLFAMGYIERISRPAACLSLIGGLFAVNALLLSPLAEFERYAGLSGVLFTPLAIAMIHLGVKQNTLEGWLPALFCLVKITTEQYTGTALLSDSQWPPYTAAHIAGSLGGITLLMFTGFRAYLWPQVTEPDHS